MLRLDMHMIAGVLQYVASPPSRRRGLKTFKKPPLIVINIASFAEAWIENFGDSAGTAKVTSPPSRRRGLKNNFFPVKGAAITRLLRGGVD